ncbi:MAG: hypothetical protein ACJ0G0_06270 [Alphaproteobacteria bacterium]
MTEPVIDIRDRIEKMRNQMTPQPSQNQEKSFQKSSKTSGYEIDKIDSEKRNSRETSSKDNHKIESKRSISDDVTEKKKEFNKNFEDTETITKINVEQNNKTGNYSSSNASQKSENKSEEKSKSVKQEETTFPQFSLNVSNPISWKLMLLIMVMQLLTNIMLVVVLYLK